MAQQQGEVLQERELHRDEPEAEGREVQDRSREGAEGTWAGRPRATKRTQRSTMGKQDDEQREAHASRDPPGLLPGEEEGPVVGDRVHARNGFGHEPARVLRPANKSA